MIIGGNEANTVIIIIEATNIIGIIIGRIATDVPIIMAIITTTIRDSITVVEMIVSATGVNYTAYMEMGHGDVVFRTPAPGLSLQHRARSKKTSCHLPTNKGRGRWAKETSYCNCSSSSQRNLRIKPIEPTHRNTGSDPSCSDNFTPCCPNRPTHNTLSR